MRVQDRIIFDDQMNQETMSKMLNDNFIQINAALQGRIRFGSTDAQFVDKQTSENIDGRFVVYTTNGTANTEDAVAHSLGSKPKGFLVMRVDKGGVVYDSGTTWTSTQLFLKCTTTSTLVTLFLIP